MASSVRRSITALIIAPMMVARALLSTQMLIGGRRRLASTMGAGARSTPPAEDVKRLVLVRHGEVDLAMFDGKKCLYGGVDIPLSSKGRDEAAAAAAVLEGEDALFDLLDIKRARKWWQKHARAIKAKLKTKVKILFSFYQVATNVSETYMITS